MTTVGIYKNMEVTYKEFENALLTLGYQKTRKKNFTLYTHDTHDSIISISHLNTPERTMIKGEFAAQSYLMEMKGVILDRDDIAKMIEQARLGTVSS